MNYGPLIFLGVLVAFVSSWWGLIFSPQVQIGSQQATTVESGLYPAGRPGVAAQGHEVYVAAGCVHCHSQQVRQDGYVFDVVLTSGGTNPAAVATLVQEIAPNIKGTDAVVTATNTAPVVLLRGVRQQVAARATAKLTEAGAGAQAVFIPLGPDMKRNWGARRSVAADYLYDYPVQIGNSRLGPDLANVGARPMDANWHLLHLYHPRTVVNGSIMPAYQYLFETRKIGRQPSPDALKLPEAYAPKAGYEVVPKPEALQLVAYLQSLRLDQPLFEAPASQLAPAAPAAGETGATNAPGATNAAAATTTPQP
jgi:cbb3-type cytochrome oxidase cytochrome c subunit